MRQRDHLGVFIINFIAPVEASLTLQIRDWSCRMARSQPEFLMNLKDSPAVPFPIVSLVRHTVADTRNP